MPSQNTSIFQVAYSGDEDSFSENTQNNIYMQELVDGYNLTYNITCAYLDQNNQVQDCTDGISDETQSMPYTFWIEQVTSENRITHSFTMNRLFFMLDSKSMITILALHNDDLNLDEINT